MTAADIAYAGDNQGNMWKFDLTSYDASEWGVAFSGEPLFTAQRPAVYGSSGTRVAPADHCGTNNTGQ